MLKVFGFITTKDEIVCALSLPWRRKHMSLGRSIMTFRSPLACHPLCWRRLYVGWHPALNPYSSLMSLQVPTVSSACPDHVQTHLVVTGRI
jgi:hypothetical protein